MNYSEPLKAQLNSYFTERWGAWEYTRGWLKADCPVCGKEKKFGVQIEDNKAHCFSCEFRSGLLATVRELEDFKTNNEVYRYLKQFNGSTTYYRVSHAQKDAPTKNLQLPDEFKLVGLYKSQVALLVERNLKSRGFKIKALMRKGIGFCASGKYGGRIIIPYYEDGNLIYFNARKFIDIGEKFKNPTKDDCGVGKADILYNVDALQLYKKVYLFESSTNCLTLGNNTVGTGGKSPSPKQKSKILQSPVEELIIGFDDDAYLEALKLGMEFVNHKKVKVLKFPYKKDANAIGKKATKELEKSTPFVGYKELYKMYLDEKRAINTRN